MRVGILGAGNIGGALARLWQRAGLEIMVSSRHPGRLKPQLGPAGTLAEAARFGEVVLLAVPFGALQDTLKTLAPLLEGKVVIDAMNPFPQRDGRIAEEAQARGPSGLTTRDRLPGAKVVRAFSSVPAGDLESAPREAGSRIAIPFAGDDAAAKETASRLIRQAGFEPVDLGTLDESQPLDPGGVLFGLARPERELREVLLHGGSTRRRFTKKT